MSDERKPETVLMLCNHNVIRSPMAEALLRNMVGRKVFVDSAGVRVGPTDPFVVAVLAEQGMDISDHEPKTLEDLDDTWFDLVIAFSKEAHDAVQETKALSFGELLYWPADDPTVQQGSREQMLNAYRAVRDSIARRLKERFGELA